MSQLLPSIVPTAYLVALCWLRCTPVFLVHLTTLASQYAGLYCRWGCPFTSDLFSDSSPDTRCQASPFLHSPFNSSASMLPKPETHGRLFNITKCACQESIALRKYSEDVHLILSTANSLASDDQNYIYSIQNITLTRLVRWSSGLR